MRSAAKRVRIAALLARHLLHTMGRHRARVAILLAALSVALGIGIGLLAFVTSIEDSFRERGRAVGGVSDFQVEPVSLTSSLPPRLAGRLSRLAGTRYAVPMAQQRVTLATGSESAVATAIGIDRSARRLRSAVQRELDLEGETGRRGIALSRALAGELGGVEPGQRLTVFAYGRSPSLRVARIVDADAAIEDIVTLPRAQLQRLRGAPGRPNVVYVKLDPGASAAAWERRASAILPSGARLTTAATSQGELDHVLDFTVRAPTLVFGLVVLAIAALLIYVLQLMRMLERQEDLGLLRALGSGRAAPVLAESAMLVVLLAAAVVPGILIGTPIAHYLAAQVPSYLTDVFGFNMQVEVRPGVVAIAAGVALVVGVAATVAALASARGSIASQLGRSPQAGATVVSTISLRSALALLGGGAGCLALGLALSGWEQYPAAAAVILVGLALLTPGLVGLVALALGRSEGSGPKAVMVARSAFEANPRRAAMAAAIMALGIAAVVPPQLAERALVDRLDLIIAPFRPGGQDLLGSDDAYYSVPITARFARRALRDEAAPAEPIVFTFVSFRGRKVELRGVDPRGRRDGVLGKGIGLPSALPQLRRNPQDILVSRVMAAGLDLSPGESIRLRTPSGPRRLEIVGEVEDFSWPSGTIYMDIRRYRRLYGTSAINVLAVRRRAMIDEPALERLRPLHTISGSELVERIEEQMDKSTQGLLAMRALTLLAALVAVGGILATAVFARRREWAVLRAMGMRSGGLFAALALETLLVMALGGICGAVGGVVSFRGPTLGFLESQGYVVGTDIAPLTVLAVFAGAVLIGTVATALPAWLTARAPLSDALSYE
jgi:putative ABC transport system permease protein